jgi:ATP-dependent transcriptional regulator
MILTTKLHIPRSSHTIINRPRLMRLLDEGKGAKLILVSAQAGYGKTTALSEWVLRNETLAAWVSLDRSDNDWATFWRYILASIKRHVPEFGSSIVPLLEGGASTHSELAIQALLNEFTLLNEELTIVLDDYHRIELPAIHDSLVYLVERLPSLVRLCIASRTELPFPVTRLSAKGELHRVDMQDLQFHIDEGIAFFREATELMLTVSQATKLVRQTEGWISGLQLAAISLRRSENLDESVRRLDGRQHRIFDYLLEEVFSNLADPLCSFLLETSVLDRMNSSLCQAVTGHSNSEEQLDELERLNLFLIPLDDQRQWYRYHHLLSLFLKQLLIRTNPEKLALLHFRAAVWFEANGFREEAVEHYINGGRYVDAIRVIENNLSVFTQANVSALRRWVSALPEDSWADNPRLTLFSISALVVGGRWSEAYQQAEHANTRFDELRNRLHPEEWRIAMGNLHFFCGVVAFLQQDLERASSGFELAEQLMPEGSSLQLMGRNRYRGNETMNDLLAIIGNLREAEPFFLRWIQAWRHKRQFPFIGYMYAAYGCLLYELNRLEEAETITYEAQQREDLQTYARLMVDVAITASRIHRVRGRPNQALEQLRRLEAEIVSPDYPLFIQKINSERAYLSLFLDMPQPARDWMESNGLSHEDDVTLDRVPEYLILSRVLASDNRFEEALILLNKLDRLAASSLFQRDQIRLAVAYSVTLWRAGRIEDALPILERTLSKAEPQGYIRSFVDEGLPMAEMLAKLLGRGGVRPQGGSQVYIRHLIALITREHRDEQAEKPVLTVQEVKVLTLLVDGLSNKEIAHRMTITTDTVKFHIKNTYRKLEASNRMQAVQRAREWNVL